jgi:hypothetical protein
MLPCVLPMIIHRQTWNQNKITDSKKTVSDTDTITCWDQKEKCSNYRYKKKKCTMVFNATFNNISVIHVSWQFQITSSILHT